MSDKKPCPEGAAVIERIGWDDDNRFSALLVFPTGAPDLPVSICWEQVPVWLSVAEPEAADIPEPVGPVEMRAVYDRAVALMKTKAFRHWVAEAFIHQKIGATMQCIATDPDVYQRFIDLVEKPFLRFVEAHAGDET